ncbi:unnamed protein product [Bursaphelenchus xylophilus]|uniref:Vacuolar protein sorting-associated protein 16 homolog n=1 Tax=Bursaphelenchus xylophilus TaxID=6326 RepID=A0A1I7SA13_BURXY|nr:unnamed protein product [Bursaphelenchus xylophilus]CAG9126064.1 unnamed protein product [Bursaphelenchus xylophilus]
MPLVDSSATIIGQNDVRKVQIYTGCRFGLTPLSKVAICPLGGPIAIVNAKEYQSGALSVTRIYKGNGEFIAQVEVSHLLDVFWTMAQKLVLLSKNGRVLVYTATGQSHKTFFMDNKTESLDIHSAVAFHSRNAITGLACLKSSGQLFAVNDVESSLLWRIVDVSNSQNIPTVWTMVPTVDGPMMVWTSGKAKFYMAGQGKSPALKQAEWMFGDYTDIQTDYFNESLALLNTQNKIQIVSPDLEQELYRIDTDGIDLQNTRVLWFKEDLVMLQTAPNVVYCTKKEGESNEYKFPYDIHTSQEPDGLTIYTNDSVHALHPVSSATRRVLSMASQAPGAFLYEASLKFRRSDPQVNDYVQQIGDAISEAVKDCFEAATEIRTAQEEENLLAAAVFGQSLRRISSNTQRIEFSEKCKMFRVLRFLYERGIPLSFKQLEILGIRAVLDRLIELRLFAAADIIATQTQPQSRSRIIAHWALDSMDKVSNGLAEENALCERIIQRFKEQKHVSFAETALVAHEKGLQRLASRLLDLEVDVTKQVKSFLKLKKQEKALEICAKCNDPDLLYLVIRHLKADRNPRELELTLQKVPNVFQMYKEMTKDENPARLLALYQQSDDFRRQALYYLNATADCNVFDTTKLTEQLAKAQEALQSGGYSQLANLTQQHQQLVKENAILEEKYATSLVDKTLKETFKWAVIKRPQQADVLRKKYKLNDLQYWYWTLEALAENDLWQRFEHFAREQKPPRGFFPLIQILAKHKRSDLATKFVEKLQPSERPKAWAILGENEKACRAAAEIDDFDFLHQLRLQKPEESEESKLIQQLIDEIRQQKPSTSA